jgi:peptidoglycan/xylan/chitin deacetylase (PgdA/CDA1 family)
MIVTLPADVRCAIALSYDLEMCAGYQPDGINHGRIMPELKEYVVDLCSIAEQYGVRLHFFYVANGFDQTIDLLREILRRGHILDSHTYTHLPLITDDLQRLDDELALTNRLFEERLGYRSTVLRGPGGYPKGLDDKAPNQVIILKNGFKWVSCRAEKNILDKGSQHLIKAPLHEVPYVYPTGLVEIPIQGAMDRTFFDMSKNVDTAKYQEWRTTSGGKPVARHWKAPWTPPDALQQWIRYHREAIDFVYEHRLLWVPVWHPLSHNLHDRDNVVLRRFLEHCQSKDERVWVCTVRDAAAMLVDAH